MNTVGRLEPAAFRFEGEHVNHQATVSGSGIIEQ